MNLDYLFVVASLGGGGSEKQLSHLTSALAARGLRAGIAVWRFSDDDPYVRVARDANVQVVAVPSGSLAVKLRFLRRLIAQTRPRVVHSFSFYLNFPTALAAWRLALAVGSVRSSLAAAVALTGRVAGRLSRRWPGVQIYNNHAAAAELSRYRWLVPKRVKVVANHLDLARFPRQPVPAGPPRILAIGSLYPVKRWDRLLRACARVKRNGHAFELTILGEGPLRPELERLAGELGLAAELQLPGFVADPRPYLAASAFGVHTADSEGASNAIMEYVASARPVVTTDAGDARAYVTDGRNGFVVPVAGEELLAERIEQLVASPELRAAMGEASGAMAAQLFGKERFADEMLEAYDSFLTSRGATPGRTVPAGGRSSF